MKRSICILVTILVIVLLVAIAAMVIAAITLANITNNKGSRNQADTGATTAKPAGPDLEWWKSTPIYQVYPRSFQDSDGNGLGDLVGIKKRIPYLRDLGIKAVWLSPVYESPQKDYGYDVANFTNIDPMFGTLDEFNDLAKELHANGNF